MADKSFNKLPKTNMPVTPKTSKFGKTPMPTATTKGLPSSGRVNMNRMSADDKSLAYSYEPLTADKDIYKFVNAIDDAIPQCKFCPANYTKHNFVGTDKKIKIIPIL